MNIACFILQSTVGMSVSVEAEEAGLGDEWQERKQWPPPEQCSVSGGERLLCSSLYWMVLRIMMKICDKYLVFQITQKHPDSFIPPHCHNIIAIDIVSSILTDDPTSIWHEVCLAGKQDSENLGGSSPWPSQFPSCLDGGLVGKFSNNCKNRTQSFSSSTDSELTF